MVGHDDMMLPAGMTCGVCENWMRCKPLIYTLNPENTACDFSPSRFKPSEIATLRAQLAEAREAARTCASLLRLLHTSGAINIGMDVTTVRETLATVQKWEG